MKPVNQEQVVQTAQILLAVLSDEEGSTPNKYLEGVVSGKSLLRGLIAGQLVVCALNEGKGEQTPKPKGKNALNPKRKAKKPDAAPADIE